MDKVLFSHPYLEVRKKDYYVYVHYPDCEGKSVVVLPFKKEKGETKYLGVSEICLPHSEKPQTYMVGGGINPKETKENAAIRELKEETGYTADEKELIYLGESYLSKACDTIMHLFAIEITDDVKKEKAKGDGTKGEIGIESVWMTEDELIDNKNPLFALSLLRLNKIIQKIFPMY